MFDDIPPDPLPEGTIVRMAGNHNLPDGRFIRARTLGEVIYGRPNSDTPGRRAVSFVGITGVHSISVTNLDVIMRPTDGTR